MRGPEVELSIELERSYTRPPSLQFCFLVSVTHRQLWSKKTANARFQKELICSRLGTILGSTMKHHLLTGRGNPPLVHCLHAAHTAHRPSAALSGVPSAVTVSQCLRTMGLDVTKMMEYDSRVECSIQVTCVVTRGPPPLQQDVMN